MTCLGYNEVFKNNLLSIFYRKTAIILLLFLQYNIKGRACLKVYLLIFLFLPVRNTLKELADFSKCARRVFLILTLKHWELILTLLWQTLKKKKTGHYFLLKCEYSLLPSKCKRQVEDIALKMKVSSQKLHLGLINPRYQCLRCVSEHNSHDLLAEYHFYRGCVGLVFKLKSLEKELRQGSGFSIF